MESILKRLIEVEQRTGEVPSILITGETGVGKGVIARRFHLGSMRSEGPFIELNCSAITETLIESELFGHEKSAFTGAGERKKGLFELADRGTLFLDEIGHAPLSLQAKLLKAIEDKKIRRVGGEKEIDLNVRLIAATNVNLKALAESGEFREDLFHRLSLIQLELPPLRDRIEDLPGLAAFFLELATKKYQITCPPLSQDDFDVLSRRPVIQSRLVEVKLVWSKANQFPDD
ncbi:MAG: sigma-54-dependent Fis family transcriptional regulator [SAR324 cluster bacterium]|nr:sigma-54-dependent Fis family transcriptional regulator [SAR324 cluster bacterium]